MDRRIKSGDDAVRGVNAAKIARFPEQKELIPGRETDLTFVVPCSFEGVVDRDGR